MQIVSGNIINYDQRARGFTVFVPYDDIDKMCRRQYGQVLIGLPDSRKASIEQIRKSWCLIEQIAFWTGYDKSQAHDAMISLFEEAHFDQLREQKFRLRDCDMTQARQFISYLIDFMVKNGVPSRKPLQDLCEDIEKYVYACLLNHRCCVCGNSADLHHVDAVGIGRDREQICHVGMRVLPMCRIHHGQAHTHGQDFVEKLYHISPVVLTQDIVKKCRKKGFYGFNSKSTGDNTSKQEDA